MKRQRSRIRMDLRTGPGRTLVTLCGGMLFVLALATAQEVGGKAATKVLYIFNGSVGSTPNTIYEVAPGKFIGNTTETPTGYGSTIFSVTSGGDASLVYQFPALFSIGIITPTLNGELFGEGGTPSSNNFVTLTRKGGGRKVVLSRNCRNLWHLPFLCTIAKR
jgi:hypothetical protein